MYIFLGLIFLISCYVLISAFRYLFKFIKNLFISWKRGFKYKVTTIWKVIKYAENTIKCINSQDINLKKSFSIKQMHIKFQKYLKSKNITYLLFYISVCSIGISIFLICIIKSYSIKYIICIIMIVNFFFISICILYNKNDRYNNKSSNLEEIFYLYFIISAIIVFSLYMFLLISRKIPLPYTIIVCIIPVFVICIIGITFIFRRIKIKALLILFTIPIYLVMILFASFVLGIYYYEIFEDVKAMVDPLIKRQESFLLIKKITIFAIKFFYNYPEDKYVCKISLIQFIAGKLLDLFMLGFIFEKVKGDDKPSDDEKKIIKGE